MQTSPWGAEPGPYAAKFASVSINPHVGIRLTANPTGDLAPYLNLTIERGTGGSNASCAGFTAQATVYSGTLASMPTTYTAAGPATEWNPSAATETRTYRISGSIADSPAIAGKSANATLTWTAHAGD